jgi:hypothetical protein
VTNSYSLKVSERHLPCLSFLIWNRQFITKICKFAIWSLHRRYITKVNKDILFFRCKYRLLFRINQTRNWPNLRRKDFISTTWIQIKVISRILVYVLIHRTEGPLIFRHLWPDWNTSDFFLERYLSRIKWQHSSRNETDNISTADFKFVRNFSSRTLERHNLTSIHHLNLSRTFQIKGCVFWLHCYLKAKIVRILQITRWSEPTNKNSLFINRTNSIFSTTHFLQRIPGCNNILFAWFFFKQIQKSNKIGVL